MRIVIAIMVLLVSFRDTAAAEWYVDGEARGANKGSSWNDAWTNLASIVWGSAGVRAGDTLYLSGGTNGRVYRESLIMGVSGQPTARITISTAKDEGHTGKVIIDGGHVRQKGIQVGHYVTVTGRSGAGTNLVFENFVLSTNGTREVQTGTAFFGGIANGVVVEEVEVRRSNNGIYFSGATEVEIRNCLIRDIWGDFGIRISGYSGSNAKNGWVHHCTIETNADHLSDKGGADAVQASGGITLNDCVLRAVPGPVNPGQHPDAIQTDGSYVRVFNNYMANFVNSAFKANPMQSVWQHYYVYNNVVVMDDSRFLSNAVVSFKGAEPGWITNPLSITNVIIANNTFVDLPGLAINGGAFDYQKAENYLVVNNLIVNCGITGTLAADIRGNGTNVVFDYNFIARGSSGSQRCTLTRDSGQSSDLVQVFGAVGTVGFRQYSPRSRGNDFHLSDSTLQAKQIGINLSKYFSDDMEGRLRPEVGNWTVGAFQLRSLLAPPKSLRVVEGSTN